MWITHRDDPGGVARYIETEVSVWYETLASVAVITCVFLGDGLLVCRPFTIIFFVIYYLKIVTNDGYSCIVFSLFTAVALRSLRFLW